MSYSSTRSQIYDVLAADSTLLSMLAVGNSVAGIYTERELREPSPQNPVIYPALVIRYLGPHLHSDCPDFATEAWETICFDRNNSYFNIEKILDRVRFVLHRKQLGGNSSGTSAAGEVRYGWRSKTHYDTTFRADTGADVFLVSIHYSS